MKENMDVRAKTYSTEKAQVVIPLGCGGPDRKLSASSASSESEVTSEEAKEPTVGELLPMLSVAVGKSKSSDDDEDSSSSEEEGPEDEEDVYIYDSDWEDQNFVVSEDCIEEEQKQEDTKISPEEKVLLETQEQALQELKLSPSEETAATASTSDSIPAMVLTATSDPLSVGRKRLARDLHKIMKQDTQHLGFSIAPKMEDCMDTWIVKLFDFPPRSFLYRDLMQLQYQFVEMEFIFSDLYPYKPPFARIVRPRFKQTSGFIIDGAICMELLSESGWNPVNDLESVIVSIRSMMVLGQARVEVVANAQERRKRQQQQKAKKSKTLGLFEKKSTAKPADERPKLKKSKSLGTSLKKVLHAIGGGGGTGGSQRQLVQPEDVPAEAPQEQEILIGPAGIIMEEPSPKGGLFGGKSSQTWNVTEATACPVDGGSYSYSETKRAHDYIIKYHQKKGWDRKGAWAKIG